MKSCNINWILNWYFQTTTTVTTTLTTSTMCYTTAGTVNSACDRRKRAISDRPITGIKQLIIMNKNHTLASLIENPSSYRFDFRFICRLWHRTKSCFSNFEKSIIRRGRSGTVHHRHASITKGIWRNESKPGNNIHCWP